MRYNTINDDLSQQIKPLYNGNISETYWKTSTDNVTRKYSYVYDGSGKLERIETLGYELVFTNDFMGLPTSSQMRDRKTGQTIGWQVQYEYEFRW